MDKQCTIKPIAYQADTTNRFDQIAHLPWAIYLDSCHPYSDQGRYDIISAAPHLTLTTVGKETVIQSEKQTLTSTKNPFDLIKSYLKPRKQPKDTSPPLPFTTGVMGYWGYDLTRHQTPLPAHAIADIPLPDMSLGLYNWSIVTDHHTQTCWLCSEDNLSPEQIALIDQLCDDTQKPTQTLEPFLLTTKITSNLTPSTYQEAFDQAKAHIYAGDCYQVNLAQRFHAQTQGNPWHAYQILRKKNPAPYASFFHLPHQRHVLSLSPEQFLSVETTQGKSSVTTQPIKGTRPRHQDPQQDQQQARTLQNSPKDQAENLMIVDLLRNDLSKNCRPGSVQVPELFKIESHPSVHHLVSTVTGELSDDKQTLDLLRDCFPGGSITGAPKIRAMEIIDILEPHRRTLYCGSLGHIDHNGNMNTNIAIRTLIHDNHNLYCYAGGAIVADSTIDAEYQETFDKVQLILDHFTQTMTPDIRVRGG